MSCVHVKTFYLVDSATFETYMLKKTEAAVDVKEYPKKVSKKIRQILMYLASVGNSWNLLGCIQSSTELPKNLNVLSHSAFAVTGKGSEPEHLSTFLNTLLALEVPVKLFCTKVQKKLSALKRLQKNRKKKAKKHRNEAHQREEDKEEEGEEEEDSHFG